MCINIRALKPYLSLGYILLLAPLLAYPQIDSSWVEEVYGNGLDAYKSGNFDSALYYWAKASVGYLEGAKNKEENKSWKKYINCQVNLGSTYQRLGKYTAAKQSIGQAIEWGELKLGKWDSTLAHCYWVLGNNYWYQGAYDTAKACYLQNEKICRTAHPPNHLSIGEAQAAIAMIQATVGKYDSAKVLYKSAIQIALNAPQPSEAFLFRCYNNFANIHKESGDYESALAYYLQAESLGLESYGLNHPRMRYVYANLGGVYKEFGYFQKALSYMQKSLEINRKNYGDRHTAVVGDLLNLSTLYRNQQDYTLALTYGQEAYQIQSEINEQVPRRWIMCLENLASIYQKMKAFDKAQEIYEGILKNQNKLIGNKRNTHLIPLLGLGVCYRERAAFKQALNFFNKGLKLAKALENTADDIPGIYKDIGTTYSLMGKSREALVYLNVAAVQYDSLHGHHYPKLSGVYNQMGDVFLDRESYDSARVYYTLAITANTPSLDKEDSFSHLELESDFLLDSHHLLKGLYGMGKTFLWEDSTSISHLSSAANSYALAISLIDKMAITYELQQSQLLFQEEILPIYEEAIYTLFLLFQLTEDPSYIEKAFAYAEKSKARFLSEALKKEEALIHAGIPDTMRSYERVLRKKISFYEKEQFAVFQPQNSGDSVKQVFLNNRLLSLYKSQDSLLQELKIEFPAYYELRYEPMTYSVYEVQATLEQEEAIMEYFLGDKWLITFCILPDTLIGNIQQKDPEMDLWVQAFNRQVGQPFGQGATSTDADLFLLAQRLYSFLWAPLSDQLPFEVKVIPDGVLGYIPFEVLVAGPLNGGERPRFLLYEHQISYSYSAYLHKWLNQIHLPSLRNKSWAGFAPIFETASTSTPIRSRKARTSLVYNQEEVKEIHELISGGMFIGDLASERQFKQHAAQFDIVHIASHAQTNDESPLFSHIAFTPVADSLEDGVLELGELFNLELNIDMIVLSACETGTGKMQRGEGIASLARAATFAGAKSIVTTLWAVSDQASSKIMYAFYENLKKGQSKDEALRMAKISYLEQSDNLNSHPFFWGGFMAIGDMRALFFPRRTVLVGLGTVIVLLVGMLLLYKKRKIFGLRNRGTAF